MMIMIFVFRFVEKLAGDYDLPLVEERHPWRLADILFSCSHPEK